MKKTMIQSKIRVLLILPQQQAGGAEIQLLNLIKGIDKDEFTVILGLLYQNDQLQKEFLKLSQSGVDIVNFDKKNKFDIAVYFRIAKFIKKNDIDIVQTFLANHHAYIPAYIAKTVVPLGGIRSTFFDDRSFFDNLLRFNLLKVFSRRKNMHLVSNSNAGKEIYVKHGFSKENIFVVPNGIDYDAFSKGHKDKIVKRFHLKGKMVLGMVSRIDKRKNHEELIEVFYELCRVHKNLVLMIVGTGPYLPELKKMVLEKGIESKVIFTFTGVRKDIPDILSTLDIFVFPSRFPEGWPNAVGEAMSAGIPVISYPCGDVKYIVTNGRDGIVTEPNKAAFKKGLESLISDKSLRKRLGANGQKTILDKFTIPIMVKRYEDIYEKIIKDHKDNK